MKRIQKILAVLLTVLVLLSGTAGCAAEKNPMDAAGDGAGLFPSGRQGARELYDDALEKLMELDELDYTMTVDITHEDNGKTDTIGMNYDIQMEQTGGKPSRMVMKGSITNAGTQGYKMDVYLLDGYFYLNVAGMKIKLKTDKLEDLAGIADVPQHETFESDIFTKITSKKKNGVTVISFTADGAKVLETLEGSLGSVSFTTGESASFDGITFGKVEGTATIGKDGYLTETKVTIPMTMQKEKAVLSYSVVYKDPGQPVVFDFPSFSGYYDYTGILTGVN